MLSHDFMDAWADLDSPVHRLDARVKLICALVLLVAVLAVPIARNEMLVVCAGLLVAVACASRLPARWVLKRMAILVPFLVLGTIAVIFVPPAEAADALPLAGRELSRQAVSVWLSVGGKCLLSLLVAVLLTGTTTSADMLRAAEALRVPRTLTALAGFAVAHLAVLVDEAGRMITAMRSRGGVRGLRRRVRTMQSMLVTLMARTVERADRIALAMVARGYRGSMPSLEQRPVPLSDVLVGAGMTIISGGLVWVSLAP